MSLVNLDRLSSEKMIVSRNNTLCAYDLAEIIAP